MKPTIFASLALVLAVALQLSGCGAGGGDGTAAPTPVSEIDATINDYEKASNECLRLTRKHMTGDVSITLLLIAAREAFQDDKGKLQQAAGKLSPPQSHRVAAITEKARPCLGP
ncbi:MAG TPA: hypothetical protein VGL24_12815 [Chthoniobacterales bacterium]